jgi:hypothetical protein
MEELTLEEACANNVVRDENYKSQCTPAQPQQHTTTLSIRGHGDTGVTVNTLLLQSSLLVLGIAAVVIAGLLVRRHKRRVKR